MTTRPTPRQIAAEIIQSLAKLAADIPALRRRRWPSEHPTWKHDFSEALRVAYLMEKRMPRLPSARRPEWLAISGAAQYAADARDAARAGDTAAAWRAAAEASYWHGAAEGLLRPKKIAARLKAEGRQKGTDTTRAKGADRRHQAIALYKAGKPWTKDYAAEIIAPKLGIEFQTARDYLKGA